MVTSNVSLVSCAPLEVIELRHKRRESVLIQMLAAAHRIGVVSDPGVLLAALQRAHRLGSCAVGRGYAVPHARSVVVAKPATLFARSERGIEWGGVDGDPVHLVLMVLSPSAVSTGVHAERVVGAVHALRLQRLRHKLLEADCGDALALLSGAAG